MEDKEYGRSIVIGGVNNVLAALRAKRRRVYKVYIDRTQTNEAIKAIERLCREQGIAVHHGSDRAMHRQLEDINHQGVVAAAEPVRITGDLPVLVPGRKPVYLMLDHIEDPGNFGSIIRSAAAFGVSGIIYPRARSTGLGSTAERVSVGGVDALTFHRIANLTAGLRKLRQAGFWVVGLAGEAQSELRGGFDYREPLVLVIGNEGRGVSRLVQENCDQMVRIPTAGGASLNAAVATAVALYEVALADRGRLSGQPTF